MQKQSSERVIELAVPANTNERLDKFLASAAHGELSRARVKDIAKDGGIVVNGKVQTRPNAILAGGEKITVTFLPWEQSGEIKPSAGEISVVAETPDYLVIDKPNNLTVHPGAGRQDGTLANIIAARLGGAFDERAGLVHRIDRQTTGLLVVAKNKRALENLQKQLAARTMSRKYVAVVQGQIKEEAGRIDAPIGRDRNDRKRMAVTNYASKPAVTEFKVLKRLPRHTVIECSLQTGRTHQIRVHMAYIKHPVLNDAVYGNAGSGKAGYGQYLHAYKLSFTDPATRRKVSFRAPLPEEFQPYVTDAEIK